jgi:hypothetical protein
MILKNSPFRENYNPAIMKAIFFSIVLSSVFTILSAQLTLEHSYNYSGTLTEIEKNEYKYFVQDVPQSQCRIYNEDHTLYKTINLEVPSGYTLNDTKFVSKYLFNSDDKVELLYIYIKTTMLEGERIYQYGLRVVDEIGTVLLNLNNGGYAELKKGSDGMKLLAYQYIYFDSYYLIYTNVYELGGSMKTVVAENEPGLNIYPNPASDMITITMDPWTQINNGQVMITDMSGHTVNKALIQSGNNICRLETAWMSPGSYVLSVLSKEQIIGSEKIEIK